MGCTLVSVALKLLICKPDCVELHVLCRIVFGSACNYPALPTSHVGCASSHANLGALQADPLGDLSTELERELGKLVKAKYHTDFYMLYNYPLAVCTA